MMKLVVMVRMSGGLIKFGSEDLGAKNRCKGLYSKEEELKPLVYEWFEEMAQWFFVRWLLMTFVLGGAYTLWSSESGRSTFGPILCTHFSQYVLKQENRESGASYCQLLGRGRLYPKSSVTNSLLYVENADVWVFFLCVVGITPLAEHLKYATKQLAYYMGLLICQEEIMPKVGSSRGRGRDAPSASSGKTINTGGRASLKHKCWNWNN
ncbi:hypothetical protein C5167_017745 [Papaver somniferum]|uniref:Uncharacterized protein n=1 Tax=Papaver somniferum TaxID=3469 RepID=A0A4Y7IKA1_PAPSO|nr:hypothetical protein C5167_017745 [Papaver somniferum]